MTRITVRALALAAALVLGAGSHALAQETTPVDSTKKAAPPAAQPQPAAGPAQGQPQPVAERRERTRRPNRKLITREEIDEAQVSVSDAFVLVQRLRPQWLRGRGTYTMNRVQIVRLYRDGAPFGRVESLSQVPLSQIKELRYYEAIEATQRFGNNNEGSAIEIITHGR